ncbi:ribonuclease H-like domain-containing protein [Circinella umbellata]|nr:ribonuclease H-like domain-containing protein [Circinella umbellata]
MSVPTTTVQAVSKTTQLCTNPTTLRATFGIRHFQTTATTSSHVQSIHDQESHSSSTIQHQPLTGQSQTESEIQEQQMKIQVTNEKPSRKLPNTLLLSIKKSQQQEQEPTSTSQQLAEELSRTNYPNIQYPNHYTVICTSDPREMNIQIASLLSKNEVVFGLDIEWQPQFKKGYPQHKTALIQICGNDTILLFQVAQLKVLPTELVKFLKDPNIFKSGVNIRGDGLKLHRDFNVLTNGLVELMTMTQYIDSPLLMVTHRRSLSTLTSLFLERNMPKTKSVRLSNWSKRNLTAKQQEYAACDAYASFKLCTLFRDLLLKQHKSHVTAFIIHLSSEVSPSKASTSKTDQKTQEQKSSSSSTPTASSSSSSRTVPSAKKPWPSSTTTIIRKAS